MRLRRQTHRDRVSGQHHAARDHHAHHTRLAHDVPGLVTAHDLLQQSGAETVYLQAGIAQTREPCPGDTGLLTGQGRYEDSQVAKLSSCSALL